MNKNIAPKNTSSSFSNHAWLQFWSKFKKNKLACAALIVFALFVLAAIYAPFLASSKPSFVIWDSTAYFPLFRYLFYTGFYTKPIDLFFNILGFTLPMALLAFFALPTICRKWVFISLGVVQFALFFLFLNGFVKNPESQQSLKKERKEALDKSKAYTEDPLLAPLATHKSWNFEVQYFSEYEKLNLLLRYIQRKGQHTELLPKGTKYEEILKRPIPTLFAVEEKNEAQKKESLNKILNETKSQYDAVIGHYSELVEAYKPYSHAFIMAKYDLEHAKPEDFESAEKKFNAILKDSQHARGPLLSARGTIEAYELALSDLKYIEERKAWLEKESKNVEIVVPALIRDLHWQDDAGGSSAFNKFLPWWELTRINRKDLTASLIFGIRVSLIVGIMAVSISMVIGIILGTVAGYFAGKTDLIICRAIEIWEAMPTFFMLLLIVAITQSKSLFLVISVLGLFGWTTKCRFMRGEVLRQRSLPYVLASVNLGFPHRKIMFSDILPNAIPPILTLLPFSMMAAITSEAGLSFLGLGEDGSTSWGVLMDEGRTVFPGESYLLWPPAILLTLLLISIALVGDALRDTLDPKMNSS